MRTYDEALDEALLASSRGKEAERVAVARLIEAFPDEPGGPSLAVLAALWRGELEEAQRQAEALSQRPPELAVRAEVDAFLGDREGAARRLEAALEAAPDDPIVLRSAYSVFGMDDPARALEIARRRIALRPHDPLGYAALGTSLLTTSVAEAEELAADPPAAFADTTQLHTLRARLAAKRRDLPEAEAHARAAVAANADSDMAWTTLAEMLKHQGKHDEAANAARFALELNRRNPLAMRTLGAVAASRGDRAEAERWEREAQVAVPALAFMATLGKTNALVRAGKRKEALIELRRLDDISGPARIAVHNIRATILLGLRDDGALQAEADAMEREGIGGAMSIQARAELDRRAGRIEEARTRLETEWLQRPGAVAAPLIRVLVELGDLEAARRIATDVPGTPADAGAVFLALDKAGLKEEASLFLDLAQRRFPEAQPLKLLRVGTFAQKGDLRAMAHAMRGLDAQHRPQIRIRMSFPKLLRALWRRARRR